MLSKMSLYDAAYQILNFPPKEPTYFEIIHPIQSTMKTNEVTNKLVAWSSVKYVGLTLLAMSGAYYVYYVRTKRCKKLEKSLDGITDSLVARVKYTWSIKNMSFRKAMDETLSETFSDGYNLWQLRLCKNSPYDDFFSIFLLLVKSNLPETHAKFQCSIAIDNPMEPIVKNHDVCEFKILTAKYGFIVFHENALQKLKSDTLVICWEVHSLINVPNVRPLENLPDISNDFINLGRLFSEERFSDITFVVGQEEFYAHKIILGSVSEVFAAMFESEMREPIEGRVEIQDIDSETFKEMLRFIYTREADFEHHAQGLLYAADKYGLETLKSYAERCLIDDLSVENVAATLAIADRYSAPALKDEAIMFIEANRLEVFRTPGWKQLRTTCPHVLAELYCFY